MPLGSSQSSEGGRVVGGVNCKPRKHLPTAMVRGDPDKAATEEGGLKRETGGGRNCKSTRLIGYRRERKTGNEGPNMLKREKKGGIG